MAAIPSRQRNKNGIGGGSTPRRHGAGGGAPFSSRDSTGHNNGTVRGTGAWGTGRLERSSPHFSHQAKAPPQQQHYHGQSSHGDRVACRDRWINITKTMVGEKSEVTTTNGCVYEGVCHVITPGDPAAGGTRGMYKVRSLFTAQQVVSESSSPRVHHTHCTALTQQEKKKMPRKKRNDRQDVVLPTAAQDSYIQQQYSVRIYRTLRRRRRTDLVLYLVRVRDGRYCRESARVGVHRRVSLFFTSSISHPLVHFSFPFFLIRAVPRSLLQSCASARFLQIFLCVFVRYIATLPALQLVLRVAAAGATVSVCSVVGEGLDPSIMRYYCMRRKQPPAPPSAHQASIARVFQPSNLLYLTEQNSACFRYRDRRRAYYLYCCSGWCLWVLTYQVLLIILVPVPTTYSCSTVNFSPT